ncbi:ubiquitin-specific protease [Trifolium repens]|nr:ubiquitin-specific protease [Trifolium repens]
MFVEIERQETNAEIQPFEKFTWKIENFSYLTNLKKIYSQPFVLGSNQWRIVLYPTGNKRKNAVNDISIYLQALEMANESEGWSRDVKVKLVVFNQLNTNMTIIRENNHDYNAKEDNRGFASFMSLTELHNPKKGFIVKDACIVGAEVLVSKSSREKQRLRGSEAEKLMLSGSEHAGSER